MTSNSTASDSLDRMIGRSKTTPNDTTATFIPAATFSGSKPGYYFGTNAQGTGYYLDAHQQPKPKKRKRIQIDESQNQVREIPSAQQLLQQAEEAAEGLKVLELTSVTSVTHAIRALQKLVERNALQRAKYKADEFMESELQLHDHLQALQTLAAQPQLYEKVFDNNQQLNDDIWSIMLELLQHANVDMSIAVVELLNEWIDGSLQEDDKDDNATPTTVLIQVMVEQSDLIALVVANLGRIQEEGEDDDTSSSSSLAILTLLQNWLDHSSSSSQLAVQLVSKLHFSSWLLQQIEPKKDSKIEQDDEGIPNRAAEILLTLVQQEEVHANLDWTKLPPYSSMLVEEEDEKKPAANDKMQNANDNPGTATVDGMEILLQAMAVYRKKQPLLESETDLLENAVLCLASILAFSPSAPALFVNDKQGPELVLRSVREKVHAGGIGLALLDLPSCPRVSEKLVQDLQGLNLLFPPFMGRNFPKPALKGNKKERKQWLERMETNLIQIFYNMALHLRQGELQERFVCKFVTDVNKIDRLIELYLSYQERGRKAEYKYWVNNNAAATADETTEMEALSYKLASGADVSYKCAFLLAHLCVHSKRCHERILGQLQMQQSGISVVRKSLEEFDTLLDTESTAKQTLTKYLEHI